MARTREQHSHIRGTIRAPVIAMGVARIKQAPRSQIDLQPLSDLVLSRKICTSNFFLVVVMVVGMSVATMMSTIVEEATHT